MEERARAKVNLYLHVTGRRTDGYHLLDSVAVFPGAADVVRLERADGLSLTVEGPFGGGLVAGDNLVLQAARAWAVAAGVPGRGRLTLVKNLPVASGIGGGSADAAATLRGMGRLWGVALPDATLRVVAAGLGADVAVCVASRAARMSGVGEVLGAAPALPRYGMVLVNPGVAVSTPAVFRALQVGGAAFRPAASLPEGWRDVAAMADDLRGLSNDLEAPALLACPVIGAVLTWLRGRPGCLLARMSGSGGTCFGLFAEADAAEREAGRVPAGWWGWGGGFTEGHPDR